MPMNNVMHLAGIGDIDRYRHALAQLQRWSGNLPVVSQCLDCDALANLKLVLRNAQAIVSLPTRGRSVVLQMFWEDGVHRFVSEQHSSRRKKTPTVHESPVSLP